MGTTLAALDARAVAELADWFAARGLPPAAQLSSWAPAATVTSLAEAGFVPAWCRSVLATDLAGPGRDLAPDPGAQATGPARRPGVATPQVVVVSDDALARQAMAVMTAGLTEGLATGEEFMRADRACEATTQLLALLDGRPVGCGSVTVVGPTAWLGAAATLEQARRRGVQAALGRARLRLAREAGCDLVGATASSGSASARNLQRLGFGLVQEEWVVVRPAS